MANKKIFDYTQDNSPARTINLLGQPDAASLYNRFTIADMFSSLQASDIPSTAVMSNTYFVGKHGNDSHSGTSLDKAMLTFSAAIAAASVGDVVVCMDAGEYEEEVVCKDGVNIFAPNATLRLGGVDQKQLTMAECSVNFYHIYRDTGANSLILFSGASGRQKLKVIKITDNGSGVAVRYTNSSTAILDFELLYVSGGGIGIGGFIASQHSHISGKDIYLDSDNAIGIQYNISGDLGVMSIQHIIDTGYSNTTAIDMNDGTLDIFVQEIVADTAYDVESAAVLNIVACEVQGTRLNDGTVNKVIANDRTQRYALPVFIEAPENKDYKLLLNIPKSITITKVTTISSSGSCTATVKINSAALGGTANSVGITQNEQTHSSSNVAVTGDDIVLTVSSNSSCTDMSVMIEYTSELD